MMSSLCQHFDTGLSNCHPWVQKSAQVYTRNKKLEHMPMWTWKSNSGSFTHAEIVGFSGSLQWKRGLVRSIQECCANCRSTYLRQIILSQLYFWASCLRDGSMIPPRRRSTRCRVDSDKGYERCGKIPYSLSRQVRSHSQTECNLLPFWIL